MRILRGIMGSYKKTMDTVFFSITLHEKYTNHEVHKIEVRGKHIVYAWITILLIEQLLDHVSF